jgi:hypothetical protein
MQLRLQEQLGSAGALMMLTPSSAAAAHARMLVWALHHQLR